MMMLGRKAENFRESQREIVIRANESISPDKELGPGTGEKRANNLR